MELGEPVHRLLKRQMKRHLDGIETPQLQDFIKAVNEAYGQFDTDYATLERSLELSSQELHTVHSEMRAVYERLILSSVDGIFAFDCECRYTAWNPSMERFTGKGKVQTLGKCAFEVFPQLKKTGEDTYFYDALAGKTVYIEEKEYTIYQAGGKGFCESRYAPLLDEDGNIIGGLAIIRDITKRKIAELALRRQHEYLVALQEMALRLTNKLELNGFFEDILQRSCQLFETSHAFIALTEPDGAGLLNLYSTGLFLRVLGRRFSLNEGLVGRVWQTRGPVVMTNYHGIPGLGLEALNCWVVVPFLKGAEFAGIIGVAYTESERHLGESEISLLKQVAQLASIGMIQEALNEANAQLAALVTTDPLTGLPNHRTVMARIDEELTRCSDGQGTCVILFLDIDHFKSINDTWGHQAGDEILREVGRRLMRNVREIDFVGRYGGEEFTVVLVDMDHTEAQLAAERLRTTLCDPPCSVIIEQKEITIPISVTASIGVAIYKAHGLTRKELIEAADVAMYQAKNSGRNRVCIAEYGKHLIPYDSCTVT